MNALKITIVAAGCFGAAFGLAWGAAVITRSEPDVIPRSTEYEAARAATGGDHGDCDSSSDVEPAKPEPEGRWMKWQGSTLPVHGRDSRCRKCGHHKEYKLYAKSIDMLVHRCSACNYRNLGPTNQALRDGWK